jgi:hypothetical protein
MTRIALVLLLAGCTAPASPTGTSAALAAPESYPMSFAIDSLLSDDDLRGGGSITEAEVQAFLQSKGSYLAGYTDPDFNGATAASLIVSQSLANGISPLYMMARIQTESSLIESGSSNNLQAATGCGCPDSGGCNQSYAGFGKQVQCGAQLMKNYFADLDAGNATIAGWNVGVQKSTSDPCSVTPSNKATAALYTYTPWVGAYGIGCGDSSVGGSSLVALIYSKYASEQTWGGGPPNPCVGLADGFYCGGDGLAGDHGTLYQCAGGQVAKSTVCAAGCMFNPPGTPDACNPAPPDGGSGGGSTGGSGGGPADNPSTGTPGGTGGSSGGGAMMPGSTGGGCSLVAAPTGGAAPFALLLAVALLALRRRSP